MTGVRQVLRARTPRDRLVGAALPAVLALALAGCGTIPPAPSATGPVPAPSVSSTSVSPRTVPPDPARPATTGPTAPAVPPRPTLTATPGPTPTGSAPTGAAPVPAPDTWVGHFRGHEVQVPRGHGATVSFTFDDGPWPGSTAAVLSLLQQHHVHAVFCLIGIQAKVYPALVHREVAGGHELCDHSRDHDLSMGEKGHRSIDAEVADGLADVTGAAPRGTAVRFYRQPGGLWSPAVVKAMGSHGLDPLRWSDDPRDWSRPGSAVIVRRVVAGLHPGVVILMHDGGGDRSQSVEALRFLLGAVVAAGWRPVLAPHVRLSAKAAARPQ